MICRSGLHAGRSRVFVARAQSAFQLWQRPVASAEARPMQGTEGAAFPFWSHDSRFIAFFEGGKLKKVAIAGGPPVLVLLQAESSATYASGHVLFARGLTLMAQAFDPDGRQLAGDAVPVTAPVSTEGSRYLSASVSVNGTLVYAPGGRLNPHRLTWFDRAGKTLGTLGDEGWTSIFHSRQTNPTSQSPSAAGVRRISTSGRSTSPATYRTA